MAMQYTTAAQDAATVRAELKRLGFNSRSVSVRSESYSMGSSVNVEVKDPRLPLWIADRIVRATAEHIRYDEMNGEILSGGNRFAHARHSDGCREILGRRHEPALLGAINKAEAAKDPNSIFRIEGSNDVGVAIMYEHNLRLWGLGRYGRAGIQCYYGNASAITEAAYLVAMYDDDQRRPENDDEAREMLKKFGRQSA